MTNADIQIRKLIDGDESMLDGFLSPYTPFAYFLRSNIRQGGISYQGEPYQADYFGAFLNNQLQGIIAHHWIGSLQIFSPDKSARAGLAQAFAEYRAINPREVNVVIGPYEQVEDMCHALGLAASDFRPGRNLEELYTLDLAEMKIPPLLKRPDISVRRAVKADLSLIIPWDHEYQVEAMGESPGQFSLDKAYERMDLRFNEGGLFVLEDKGRIVSYCGGHGFLPDWKIIGSVWTPPDLRGQSYGRAVVAGALKMLQAEGASHAVLFAQSVAAIRAYLALGFTKICDWRLDYLKEPMQTFIM